MRFSFFFVSLFVLFRADAVQATPVDIARIIGLWSGAASACRGSSSPNAMESRPACVRRDAFAEALRVLGWCLKSEVENVSGKDWEACEENPQARTFRAPDQPYPVRNGVRLTNIIVRFVPARFTRNHSEVRFTVEVENKSNTRLRLNTCIRILDKDRFEIGAEEGLSVNLGGGQTGTGGTRGDGRRYPNQVIENIKYIRIWAAENCIYPRQEDSSISEILIN